MSHASEPFGILVLQLQTCRKQAGAADPPLQNCAEPFPQFIPRLENCHKQFAWFDPQPNVTRSRVRFQAALFRQGAQTPAGYPLNILIQPGYSGRPRALINHKLTLKTNQTVTAQP